MKPKLVEDGAPAIAWIRQAIGAAGALDNVLLEVRMLQPPLAELPEREALEVLLDEFVRTWNGTPIGKAWRVVGRSDATGIVEAVLARDLAHDAGRMADESAHQIARQFLDLFPEPCVFATNGDLGINHAGSRGSAGWAPVTTATFDTGVVAVAPDRVGAVWVMDED